MHLKRQKVPKSWPTHRKGTKFVVKSQFNLEGGVPILVVLRDMLKVAQNRKEVKKALYSKQILLNNKVVKNEKNPALLFDVVTIVPSKKHYRIDLSNKGKFEAKEINENEAGKKISKIVNKKIIKGKKTQLNLSDGKNMLSEVKCNVNDSVVIDFAKKKIEKCLPLKEKSKVIIFGGKHSGTVGIVKKLKTERKMAGLITEDKEINALIKQIIVIE